MELKSRMKVNGKSYGLRLREKEEEGVNCAVLCPISEKCKGYKASTAFCALMKVLDGINLCDFGKYIVCEITEKV